MHRAKRSNPVSYKVKTGQVCFHLKAPVGPLFSPCSSLPYAISGSVSPGTASWDAREIYLGDWMLGIIWRAVLSVLKLVPRARKSLLINRIRRTQYDTSIFYFLGSKVFDWKLYLGRVCGTHGLRANFLVYWFGLSVAFLRRPAACDFSPLFPNAASHRALWHDMRIRTYQAQATTTAISAATTCRSVNNTRKQLFASNMWQSRIMNWYHHHHHHHRRRHHHDHHNRHMSSSWSSTSSSSSSYDYIAPFIVISTRNITTVTTHCYPPISVSRIAIRRSPNRRYRSGFQTRVSEWVISNQSNNQSFINQSVNQSFNQSNN